MSGQKPTIKMVTGSPPTVKSDLRFPVVGIGASAGGVTALQIFFENAPTGMDMAFVVVVHLAADHASHVDDILQRTMGMPVRQVTSTVPIEKKPHLRNRARPATRNVRWLPEIDRPGIIFRASFHDRPFFPDAGGSPRQVSDRHCAVGRGVRRCGKGLSRIKEAGGITLAQAPGDAEHQEMPQHAIATKQVDIVLPAAEMPQRLLELWANAQHIEMQGLEVADAVHDSARPAANDPERALSDILMHLRVRTGHDFRLYKRATVLRRIERRMQVNGQRDLMGYRDFLRTASEEANALLGDMLIGVTQFFRDREAFDFLEREVIATLFAQEPGDGQVRVWIAGCATGEEAYSISLQLAQARDAAASGRPIQVFATDIDEAAIARARTGSYPLSVGERHATRTSAAIFYPGSVCITLSPRRYGNAFFLRRIACSVTRRSRMSI